jgi:hypothetical protein
VSEHFGISLTTKARSEHPSAELVQDFLYYSGDLDIAEAARIAGVSTATLGRWRMMGARQLRSDVRGRLERYLSERDAERSGMQAA